MKQTTFIATVDNQPVTVLCLTGSTVDQIERECRWKFGDRLQSVRAA